MIHFYPLNPPMCQLGVRNVGCKYTPPEGKIAVALRTTTAAGLIDKVVLTVSNTGIEIPDAQLRRIFEKFYRIPSSDYWMQGGTGLGLALVQKLVEQLGGEIRVESRSMETAFTVDLPVGCCEDFEGSQFRSSSE